MKSQQTSLTAQHPDDGDLIRLIDAECSDVERAHLESHFISCDVCAARHAAFVRRARQVRAMLALGDAAPSAPGRAIVSARRPWWHSRRARIALRAALLLIAVGVVGAGAQTARVWVSARWQEVRQLLRPAPARREAPPASAAAVHFVPDRSTLTIDVLTPQAAGTMVIDIVPDTLASVLLTPSTSEAAVLILPGALRIVNRSTEMTSYVIHVPRRVQVVDVHLASQRVRRLVAAPGARWALDLRPPNR